MGNQTFPGQPTDPIKYPNDPTDPTKPGKDKPVLPYVPGYTPKDKDGNPLKPVDPNDPTKGYEVPKCFQLTQVRTLQLTMFQILGK